jgi:hypothetical protein
MKYIVLIIVVVVAIAAAVFTFRGPSPNPHGPDGQCLLTGEARIVESVGDLVVQPAGNDEWTDVTLTLRGQGTGAANGGQPMGPFALTVPVVKGRTALKLDTFKKPDGEPFVHMVMRPTDVQVAGTLRGEQCRMTKSF